MIGINNINNRNVINASNCYKNTTETFVMPKRPPENGAISQIYETKRNIFINITPENDGKMTVDIISPKNHEIMEHYVVNPSEIQPDNASYVEMLALEKYLVMKGECEPVLSGFLTILYEKEGLNEKANHLDEIKKSSDNSLKYLSFDEYLKDRKATYAILNWKAKKKMI